MMPSLTLMGAVFAGMLAAIHIYFYWCLCRAFRPGHWQLAASGVILLGFALALLGRKLTQTGSGGVFNHAAMCWLGFLLIACFWLGVRDLLQLAVRAAGWLFGSGGVGWLSPGRSIPVVLALVGMMFAYGLYEATNLQVVTLTIRTDRLPASEQVRLVAFSDLHLTRTNAQRSSERVIALIKEQEPDIVVSLGDLVDDNVLALGAGPVQAFRELRPPLGKFAVLGNQDVFNSLGDTLYYTLACGFVPLRGEAEEVGGICLVGIDDPRTQIRVSAARALALADPEDFIIFLSHRPETPMEARGLFDLQLSGHTHGGQIWPLRYLVRWANAGHHQGLTPLTVPAEAAHASLLYVSNGAGYFGPPVRFLTPPEIVVVDIIGVAGEPTPEEPKPERPAGRRMEVAGTF